MNFVFLYLLISCFDCWDISLITVYDFNRERTFNFRFPNNGTHAQTHRRAL